MVKETAMFSEPYIEVGKLDAHIIMNGHIHSESKRIRNLFLTSIPLPTKNLESYKKHKICGVVREKNGKYLVIDGYHRIKANFNKPTIKVILAL